MQSQNQTNFDYSFKEDFHDFSLIKKILTIVFLPLIPIYIISKGFQAKKWKKEGGSDPPSMIKYYVILSLIYIFTGYPIGITLLYLYFQIFLFPISIVLALYLNRIDIKASDEVVKSEEFKIIGFRKISFTFLIFFIFTVIFSVLGIFWVIFAFPTIFFILRPKIYKRFYFIPKFFIILSNNFFDFLSYIPGVSFDGIWYLEKDSEIKTMNSLFDITKFVGRNYQIFLIGNVGITALMLRIILLFWERKPSGNEVLLSEFFNVEGIQGLGFFLAIFWIVPIIMAVYFVWAFVWEDSELKVAKTKLSSSGNIRRHEEIVETTLLTPCSRSVTRIFGLIFGIPAIVWFIDKITEESGTINPLSGFALTFITIVVMIVSFFITGIAIIFMAVMYYRSGIHQEMVNKFRHEIIEMNKNKDYTITVGTFSLKASFIDSEND